MSILCIGEALIDMICTDRGRPLSEGEHFLKKPGGAPTNVAAAVAALGGRVSLAAKVGKDPFGLHLIEVMSSFGVDTKWVRQDPDRFTTMAFVSLMENGERDFHFNRGADGMLSEDDLEGLDLSAFDILHFGSATAFLPGPLQETYVWLFEKAKRAGKHVCFDPNYRQLLYSERKASFIAQSMAFIRDCDFFKVSDEEALLLTGAHSLQKAADALRASTEAVFAITLGAEGTLLDTPRGRETVPSIPVQPVDTTGAGDAFVGALLYQLQNLGSKGIHGMGEEEWREVVRRANRAGARTCEHMGAMEAFRSLDKRMLDE
jgi:fructokinase